MQTDINLRPYNTFHLDCTAKLFVTITNHVDFLEVVKSKEFQDNKCFILGGWSNILLTKERFDGIVIKNEIMGKEIVEHGEWFVVIKVGAGENRDEFVQRAIDQGYCGIENLVSIPGNVGAAPMQNIWAYGIEAKAIIESVEGIDYSDSMQPVFKTRSNQECLFGYRDSIFKQELKSKVFITHVTFILPIYDPVDYHPVVSYGALKEKLEGVSANNITPRLIADTISAIRASKLPDRTVLGTAGSFFKNPIVDKETYEFLTEKNPKINGHLHDNATQSYKLNAWQLIELSELKGITQWAVGTYKNHALVLVNHGWGTGEQLLELAQYIQSTVYEKFKVTLEPEVNLV